MAIISNAVSNAAFAATIAASDAAQQTAHDAECRVIINQHHIETKEGRQEYAACVMRIEPVHSLVYEFFSYSVTAIILICAVLYIWYLISNWSKNEPRA